ncbi:hypothetical protein LJC34_01385 [Oscillospiraceae bacterium OttesenSCG-928-G22]|nr:hypothetical protein [Oscillospiraceae bacterium OttesenSCG-928-G22]
MSKNTSQPKKDDYTAPKHNREMTRTAFYIDKLLLKRCDASLDLAFCRSRNEFVGKAIQFYIAYLNANNDTDFLAHVISQIVGATVRSSETRLARLHFKTAVEMAKMAHTIASLGDIDDDTLHKLHIRCIDEVKRINGVVNFEDAVHYQHGE